MGGGEGRWPIQMRESRGPGTDRGRQKGRGGRGGGESRPLDAPVRALSFLAPHQWATLKNWGRGVGKTEERRAPPRSLR